MSWYHSSLSCTALDPPTRIILQSNNHDKIFFLLNGCLTAWWCDDVSGMDIVSDAGVVFCNCSPIEDVYVVVVVVFWASWTTGDVSVSDVVVVFCNG